MKFIESPSIYLVGSSELRNNDLTQFLQDHNVPDWKTDSTISTEVIPEVAGRLCYMSFNSGRKTNKAYLDHIMEVNHGSILEHSTWNFIFTGISRSLTHEFVRHRVGFSYSQLSQRYVDESDVDFVVPPLIQKAKDEKILSYFKGCCCISRDSYTSLVEKLMTELSHITDKTSRRKQAREAARSVLPNCTETKLFVTGNARSISHFFDLRASFGADAEIRNLAVEWLKIMQEIAPNLFNHYKLETLATGETVVTSPYQKH